MIEELKIRAKEILAFCDLAIKDNQSPNLDVIKIIKREFVNQYNSLTEKCKAIVINKNRDLWAVRSINDSADLKYDKVLFEKVFEFAKLCKRLKFNELVISY